MFEKQLRVEIRMLWIIYTLSHLGPTPSLSPVLVPTDTVQ